MVRHLVRTLIDIRPPVLVLTADDIHMMALLLADLAGVANLA